MPLQIGQVLERRYRIEALLGQGGMGAVYGAIDLRFNTPVAIKENLEVTPDSQRQFSREAALLHQLRHPNLPRVTDYFFIPGQGQYLVMDYVDGEDLKQRLSRQGPLPEAQALHWIDRVLDALEYLHSRQVIHRDVKPANVKITPAGEVYLVDFGLAKVYDPRQETTIGARGATPGYAPPEQYGQARTDARSDVYSVGATLYSMLTGQIPPDALDLVTRRAHLSPLRQLNPKVSAQVEAAVLRAMQTAPDDRFQTGGEFRAALREPATQRTPAREPPSPSATPAPAEGEQPGPAVIVEPELAWEASRRGSQEAHVAALFTQARAAFDREAWTEAEARCTEVLSLDARHREAQMLLQKIRTGRKLSRCYAQAQAAMQAGDWQTAVVALEEVVALDASYRDARARLRRARAERARQRRLAAPPALKRRLSELGRQTQDLLAASAAQARELWTGMLKRRPRRLTGLPLAILLTTLIVLIAVSAGLYALFSAPEEDRAPTPTPGEGEAGPALAVEDSFLFTSNRDGSREIYRQRGEAEERMTQTPGGAESWSPAASASGILFTSNRDGKREIWRLQGGKTEQMTHTDGGESWGPVPSVDGILFTSNRDGKREIYRLHGGQTERMTHTVGGESWGPVVTASGILFTSTRDGKREIYRLHGGKPERMTHTARGESWGPIATADGILFTSDRSGKREIWRLHGGETEQVTDTPGDGESWGPVATAVGILFTSDRDGKREIYRLDGEPPERVTSTRDPWESWLGDDE